MNKTTKSAMMPVDSAGGTSRGSGNPPAIPLDSNTTYRRQMSLLEADGFLDAQTDFSFALLQRAGYSYARPYLNAIKRQRDSSLLQVRYACNLMSFDRLFQAVIFKYIGIFETQIKARYSRLMEAAYGEYAIYDQTLFLKPEIHKQVLDSYQRESLRGLRTKDSPNGGYRKIPLQSGIKRITLGTFSKLYANTACSEIAKQTASFFGVSKNELSSLLKTVTAVRNICAHFDSYLVRKQIPSMTKKLRGIDADTRSPFYIVPILLTLLGREIPCEGTNRNYAKD